MLEPVWEVWGFQFGTFWDQKNDHLFGLCLERIGIDVETNLAPNMAPKPEQAKTESGDSHFSKILNI